MKRFLIIPLAITLVTSIPVKGQKHYKNFHGQKYCSNNLNFTGGFIAGLFSAKPSTQLITKDICSLNIITRPVNGGWLKTVTSMNMDIETDLLKQDLKTQMVEEIFVKISRRGNWFIDAPRKFKGIISKKLNATYKKI